MKLSDGTEARLEFEYDWIPFVDLKGETHKVRITRAFLLSEGKDTQAFAICSPKDQFRKSEGRRIALQRLMAQLSKEDRAIVGQAYFKRKVGK